MEGSEVGLINEAGGRSLQLLVWEDRGTRLRLRKSSTKLKFHAIGVDREQMQSRLMVGERL